MAGKSWRAKAQRRWSKKAIRIKGDGQYAFLTWCRDLEVTPVLTRDDAEELKRRDARTGCGRDCVLNHEIIDLSDPRPSDYETNPPLSYTLYH